MTKGSGSRVDELELLKRTMDALPSSVLALDKSGKVLLLNATAAEMIPSLRVGMDFRSALEQFVHPEKVDLLLIRREVATFAATRGGPEMHWMVWEEPQPEGLLVLTVWETDWSEVLNERRAAFMMAASHELRGPLTTLRGFSEILNMDTGNLTAEQAEAAAIIEMTAKHLTVLVEDVFDLSRNSFGELRLDLCDVNLGKVLESVGSSLRAAVEQRQQHLVCVIEEDLPLVKADEARATQIISNLINNASFHNPEGTSITATVKIEEPWIRIDVEDDGQGLPFEDPLDAFRSFRRGESAAGGDRTGSGIGLSLTKRLVQLHRGRITVQSESGVGSTFTVRFPIDRDSALDPMEPGPA